MDWKLILEFLVIVGALAMGARMGGVGLGLWGAVGLFVLVVCFDVGRRTFRAKCFSLSSRSSWPRPRWK